MNGSARCPTTSWRGTSSRGWQPPRITRRGGAAQDVRPERFSFPQEEIDSFGQIASELSAIPKLPPLDELPPKHAAEVLTLPPDHTGHPNVMGVDKDPLTRKQYALVKAIWEAPGHTLNGDRLRELFSDAVNTLMRVKRLDDDWNEIIVLPGRGRKRGYRIADPQGGVGKPIRSSGKPTRWAATTHKAGSENPQDGW